MLFPHIFLITFVSDMIVVSLRFAVVFVACDTIGLTASLYILNLISFLGVRYAKFVCFLAPPALHEACRQP